MGSCLIVDVGDSRGLTQLQHYMAMKRTGLGYLLVFDGRKRDFGRGLAATNVCSAGTMFVRFVDVRSTIPAGDEAM